MKDIKKNNTGTFEISIYTNTSTYITYSLQNIDANVETIDMRDSISYYWISKILFS